MNSLIRRADRLAEALKARQLRRAGYCPRCGKKLTLPLITVETDEEPDICSCRQVTIIHMGGPPVVFRAIDPQTGEIIPIEKMQTKYMKSEVQDDE